MIIKTILSLHKKKRTDCLRQQAIHAFFNLAIYRKKKCHFKLGI